MNQAIVVLDVLTLREVAAILRCSKTHVSNIPNGKVDGVPKLTHVRMERRLAIFEGMGPSEILGLQRHDLEEDSVWVRRRMFKGNIDTPKTNRSARRVAVSQGTKEVLTSWIDGLASTSKDAWLFPATTIDTPMRLNNLRRRNFAPKLTPVKLEWATFQVMRRSFASLAKEAGVDAHTRSAHMGNSVDVNENEYAVSSFEARLAAVRKLEFSVDL